jgi:hypothetical protein
MGLVGASGAKGPPRKEEFNQECAKDIANEGFTDPNVASSNNEQLEAAVLKGKDFLWKLLVLLIMATMVISWSPPWH